MSVDWTSFFPPGERVMALPGWKSPRLYLSARDFPQRWDHSSLYPASRRAARAYRLLLRTRAAAGLQKTRTVSPGGWPLGEFSGEALPQMESVVVLAGTPGPAQMITAQLREGKGRVLAYLKHAGTEVSRRRLRQEWSMLCNLPFGVGPEPLKFGPMCDGEALLQRAVIGKAPRATLPPPKNIVDLLDSLVTAPGVPLEAHPWALRVRESGAPDVDAWLEPLSGRNWPVVAQHGDFAPWNLIIGSDGALRAIDWEYGDLEGFPYLDLAFYLLQTSALIYRRKPLEAARRTTEYLHQHPTLALNRAEAQAITSLAAYDAYQKSSEDARSADAGLQDWRREIWESRPAPQTAAK